MDAYNGLELAPQTGNDSECLLERRDYVIAKFVDNALQVILELLVEHT